MPRQRGIRERLTSFARWALLAVLVCAAGLVVGRQFLAAQLDEQIRVHVERMFAEHYRKLDVHVEAARRIEGKGIEIRGLSLRSRTGDPAHREWMTIDEMLLTCRADLAEILSQKPAVRSLTLRRLKICATCLQQGQWNVAGLLPLPKFNGSVPRIDISDATIEVKDLGKGPTSGWALRDLNVQMRARADQDGVKRWYFTGTLRGDHFQDVSFQGKSDATGEDWSATGKIGRLEISQRLLQSLPADLSKHLSFLTSLVADADLGFRIGHRKGSAQPVDFVLEGGLSEGSVEDPRLPFGLSKLQAAIYCDNQQLRITNVSAQSGSTQLKLNCKCNDYLRAPRLELDASIEDLPLDGRLYRLLPKSLQDEWDKFAPTGAVNVGAHLTWDGKLWQPDVTIQCRGVSFAYYKFPLRLQQGFGAIHYADNRIQVNDFTAVVNGQTVTITADFRDPGPRVVGWLTVGAGGPIPLGDELIAAMHPMGQRLMRSLHPSGSITVVEGCVEKRSPDEPPRARWEVQVNDCSLQYDRFPYAIQNITGHIRINGSRWEFLDMRGHHGSNYLTCEGGWAPMTDGGGGGELTLNFKCWDVPLDDSLRAALGQFNAGMQHLWDGLRPRGSVDYVVLNMRHQSRTNQTSLDLRGEKWPPAQNVPGRTIYINPTWLPLPLEDVTGTLTYADGQFQLHDISAVRDNSRVELEGRGQLLPDQGWEIAFSRVTADRMNVDREFVDAMPEAFRPALRQLKYTGTVSVNGSASLRGGAQVPVSGGWDLLLDMEDAALENELRLEHIHGGVRLTGYRDARGFQSRGELNVDSVMTRGIQLTQVQGPFWLDPKQVLFGRRATPAERQAVPRQVVAHALGGVMTLDGQVLLDNELHFTTDVTLTDGSMLELARTLHPTSEGISGKVSGEARLVGYKAGLHTLQGGGRMQLHDADIYELPVMARLLSVLSLRAPDGAAFTSSDVEFRVNGEQLYFDRINFNGDVLSLRGQGWMDLNRQINLNFYALVGREEMQLPIVKTILAEASRKILAIHVEGTVDQPQVIRKALPDLDETLQRIFPEAAGRTAGATPQPPNTR